ncbi:hypothetical protein BDQ17DRAFT_1542250 [Cyathus striatus]|nr:hypothetical protein BDQ17DRAFT_1542250 [Cyathus striatus]
MSIRTSSGKSVFHVDSIRKIWFSYGVHPENPDIFFLNKFQIKNDYDKDDSNIFLNLFQRSGSSIKRLDLFCCPIDSIIRLIQQLRDVEELYLWNIDADELPEIISCLGHNLSDCSTDIQFLPRLQKLGVCFSGDLDNLKVFETIREVMIARTRSFTSTAPIEDRLVQHLSFVKCSITHVHPASYFAYNSELKELKGLGNKLGIEVEVDMPPAERLNEVPAAAITGGSGRGGLVEPSSGSSLF